MEGARKFTVLKKKCLKWLVQLKNTAKSIQHEFFVEPYITIKFAHNQKDECSGSKLCDFRIVSESGGHFRKRGGCHVSRI